ncbi:MAG: class II aldolase/adducin family protein [Deltaproteobacteria bacterium]|nr:class II aldolase/adducin family protein [Deltaproteobacteria bacterium]
MSKASAEELARTLRVAHLLGLVSLYGHSSVRVGPETILVTPGRALGSPPPNRLRADDVLSVSLDGSVLEGRYPPPRDIAVHLAIYRARREVEAVLHTHQPEMLALGLVERELLPLAHQGADLIQSPLPRFGSGELVTTQAQADALVQTMGAAAACNLPGHGVLVVGTGLAHVLCRAQQLEEQARMTRLAISMGELKTVSRDQAERIAGQRAGMEDFRNYYAAIDPGPGPAPPPNPDPDTVIGVKELVARSCHILRRFGVVRHLEHVSHRLPEPGRFVISPRGDLGQLRAEQVASVDMAGNWVDGPLEPPPFRFLHRDIFLARADVRAIVHTHETYGRLYPAAGLAVLPVHRTGALVVRRRLPVYDIPDLIFDEEPRRAVLALLGDGPIVHERAHGTDYVAATIEKATAAAVHREWIAELYHRAAQLGTPRPLSDAALEQVSREEPAASEWWDYWLGL